MNSGGLAGLGQTIAIVDRSGKVVSTSRHLLDVFSDAKYAYRERKAQLAAERQAQGGQSRPQPPRRAYTIDEQQSVSSSRRSRHHGEHRKSSHRRHSTSPSRRRSKHAGVEGGHRRGLDSPRHSGSPYSGSPMPRSPAPLSPLSPSASGAQTPTGQPFFPPIPNAIYSPVHPHSPFPPSPNAGGYPPSLAIREPEMGMMRRASLPVVPKRSFSASGIDPDLAYGEAPPNLFEVEHDRHNEAELKGLVGKVRGLLDEAHCLQHSVTQTVQRLQKNPEAMAAVALTLAEISNLIKKMSPGALFQVRRIAPAVFALLSSPQFLVAAGVGVGVTIVAFGGYKIVRKIQEKRRVENQMEEMLEISADVSRIDTWRRGVAESDAGSVGTSVEGEFISATAARLKGLSLNDAAKEQARAVQSRSARETAAPKSESKQHRARASTVRSKSVKTSKSGSSSRSKSSRSRSTKDEGAKKTRRKSSTAEAKPSPLRLMFRS